MRCIGLLQQPSYQVFTVADGQSLDPHRPPAIRELHTWPTVVSYGFQDAALQLYCATVEEELRQTAKNLKKQIDPADWRWILAALRLGAHLDRPTADLPLPLKRLVLIASLLLCQPAVLILDEPTVALDSRQKRDLRSVLKDYAASGRLVMMVSHDQDFVEDLGRAISVASVGAVEVKKIE
jgi:energy-coupling factor transporter ATP-binding protein EcfA2